ncbi:MAG: glutathione S-transferase family protein [Burkholderiales bacterium]|nr:glutathione S-transferase family protein [Burkholderiales bacterium]
MTDLILHHYPVSPFSEKVRLVLGYKQLAWKSVIIPSVMPKPDVVALTGGYRKTPFLQIGSDVYCDSALICDVLEHLAPEPTLYPPSHKGLARIVAQWADEKLFWAAMAYNFSPKGTAQLFAGNPDAPIEQWGGIAKAFGEDRTKMRLGMPRMPLADAAAAYKSYLRRMANMLDGQDYLLGDAPCVADFAAYHPLWFTRTQTSVMAGVLDATPAVLAWMDRMAAIGHGRFDAMTATESIAACAQSTGAAAQNDSTFQDEHDIALGSRVTVTSESFGPEPTEGELVAATRTRYTLQRVDERAGIVHVHFPRIGYILKKANA